MTLLDLLNDTNSLVHVSTTGAGIELQRRLWVPGSSKYFVGCFTPYRRTQTHSFLGHIPKDSYVCADVAYDMAASSYIRATEAKVHEGLDGNPVGIGVTAAVATNRLPRGELEAHVSIITQHVVRHLHVPFKKEVGAEARWQQDDLLSEHVLGLLTGILRGEVPTDPEAEEAALRCFYEYPIFSTDGTRKSVSEREPAVYLPATLNPIHDGHRAMCKAVEDRLSPLPGKIRVQYLVSSVSPHKGRLSVSDMLFKAGMLRAERWRNESRQVEFTRDEPLFIDKARKRPGSAFVIGADTMQRMLDPKWGPEITPMLAEMRTLGTKFYVMGRVISGQWVVCEDISVPGYYGGMFVGLPGRVDISSTELRAKA